jgi:PAS domain-containing protein
MKVIMDNYPEAIYFKDLQSRFFRVNKNWTRRHGLKNPEDIIGKTDFDLFDKPTAQVFYRNEQDII